MISASKRKAIWELHQAGKMKKEIARLLELDPKTVRRIVDGKGETPGSNRADQSKIDLVLLESVFKSCQGWGKRTHEVLTEEHGIKIGYSTLNRLIEKLGLKTPLDKRSQEVEVLPAAEFQHDTSPIIVKLGNKLIRLQCSSIIYRYSRVRYVKFYRSFDRYAMKSFFFEALSYFKYVPNICVVDNTNLAVLRGTGKNAVFNPEMIQFAKPFRFEWLAHELKHSDRKASVEKSFSTINSNFLPGRIFKNLEDLNAQAFEWATTRYAHRPDERTKLIPIQVFETEKLYMNPVPDYVHPPFREFDRITDRYGYVSIYGNDYWVPGKKSREEFKVIETPNKVEIYRNRELLIAYPLASRDIKGQEFKPTGVRVPKKTPPKKLTHVTEEAKLRAIDPVIDNYLNFIQSKEGAIRNRHWFVRNLYSLFLRLDRDIFVKTIERATHYKINSIETLERITVQIMRTELHQSDWPSIDYNQHFEDRQAFIDGRFSEEVNLNHYQELLTEKKRGNGNGDQ